MIDPDSPSLTWHLQCAVCTGCGDRKHISEYYNTKKEKKCKECVRARVKKYNESAHGCAKILEWRTSDRGKLSQHKKNTNEKGTARMKAFQATERYRELQRDWSKTTKGREKDARMKKTPKGRARIKRARDKFYSFGGNRMCARIGNGIRSSMMQERTSSKLSWTGLDSKESLMIHMQEQFEDGMSWKNYGRQEGVRCWEIDHIIPQSFYDLDNPADVRRCWDHRNLRPCWSFDNNSKNNNMPCPSLLARVPSSCHPLSWCS